MATPSPPKEELLKLANAAYASAMMAEISEGRPVEAMAGADENKNKRKCSSVSPDDSAEDDENGEGDPQDNVANMMSPDKYKNWKCAMVNRATIAGDSRSRSKKKIAALEKAVDVLKEEREQAFRQNQILRKWIEELVPHVDMTSYRVERLRKVIVDAQEQRFAIGRNALASDTLTLSSGRFSRLSEMEQSSANGFRSQDLQPESMIRRSLLDYEEARALNALRAKLEGRKNGNF